MQPSASEESSRSGSSSVQAQEGREPTHWERPRPHLGITVAAAALTFLVIGVPTDIVPNPVFGREVPVRPWEPWVLLATSVFTGLWFGLQRARRVVADDGTVTGEDSNAPAYSAAGLALFAVACPVCNKIVLIALGTSGALGIWEPLQPWLAAISLVALVGAVGYAARRRPCVDGSCRVRSAS
ncbi:hypothetical protein [Intrasporangium sp. DVR]|uniref:hypothetical protein n=1 Tax=Intrasporangium sp. DVR TaxID=3127867 RepID=UPI00313A4E4A